MAPSHFASTRRITSAQQGNGRATEVTASIALVFVDVWGRRVAEVQENAVVVKCKREFPGARARSASRARCPSA
jgi:hypothetical protein